MSTYLDLLPIGTVVLLQGARKKLMITGIKPVSSMEPERVYVYIGVSYPEGYLSSEYQFLFDHKDIDDVIFTGYQSPERERFLSYLEKEGQE